MKVFTICLFFSAGRFSWFLSIRIAWFDSSNFYRESLLLAQAMMLIFCVIFVASQLTKCTCFLKHFLYGRWITLQSTTSACFPYCRIWIGIVWRPHSRSKGPSWVWDLSSKSNVLGTAWHFYSTFEGPGWGYRVLEKYPSSLWFHCSVWGWLTFCWQLVGGGRMTLGWSSCSGQGLLFLIPATWTYSFMHSPPEWGRRWSSSPNAAE